jgi:hypothetical protein
MMGACGSDPHLRRRRSIRGKSTVIVELLDFEVYMATRAIWFECATPSI